MSFGPYIAKILSAVLFVLTTSPIILPIWSLKVRVILQVIFLLISIPTPRLDVVELK